MEVAAHVDAVDEGALLTDGFAVEGLWWRGEEHGYVVPENAREDHDYGDGEEDPVAATGGGLFC